MKDLNNYYVILKSYFRSNGIDSDCISPNMVAEVADTYFSFMQLNNTEVVQLSNNL